MPMVMHQSDYRQAMDKAVQHGQCDAVRDLMVKWFWQGGKAREILTAQHILLAAYHQDTAVLRLLKNYMPALPKEKLGTLQFMDIFVPDFDKESVIDRLQKTGYQLDLSPVEKAKVKIKDICHLEVLIKGKTSANAYQSLEGINPDNIEKYFNNPVLLLEQGKTQAAKDLLELNFIRPSDFDLTRLIVHLLRHDCPADDLALFNTCIKKEEGRIKAIDLAKAMQGLKVTNSNQPSYKTMGNKARQFLGFLLSKDVDCSGFNMDDLIYNKKDYRLIDMMFEKKVVNETCFKREHASALTGALSIKILMYHSDKKSKVDKELSSRFSNATHYEKVCRAWKQGDIANCHLTTTGLLQAMANTAGFAPRIYNDLRNMAKSALQEYVIGTVSQQNLKRIRLPDGYKDYEESLIAQLNDVDRGTVPQCSAASFLLDMVNLGLVEAKDIDMCWVEKSSKSDLHQEGFFRDLYWQNMKALSNAGMEISPKALPTKLALRFLSGKSYDEELFNAMDVSLIHQPTVMKAIFDDPNLRISGRLDPLLKHLSGKGFRFDEKPQPFKENLEHSLHQLYCVERLFAHGFYKAGDIDFIEVVRWMSSENWPNMCQNKEVLNGSVEKFSIEVEDPRYRLLQSLIRHGAVHENEQKHFYGRPMGSMLGRGEAMSTVYAILYQEGIAGGGSDLSASVIQMRTVFNENIYPEYRMQQRENRVIAKVLAHRNAKNESLPKKVRDIPPPYF